MPARNYNSVLFLYIKSIHIVISTDFPCHFASTQSDHREWRNLLSLLSFRLHEVRSGEISYNNPLIMPRRLHSKHFVFFSRHDIAPVIFLTRNPKCRNRVLIVISPSQSPKGARATAVEKSHKEKCIQFTKKRSIFAPLFYTLFIIFKPSNSSFALCNIIV